MKLLNTKYNKRKISMVLAMCIMLWCSSTSAQDLNFSQFQDLPLLRNPALAGEFIGDLRMQGVFRNQWQQITVPFRTGGFSTEVNIPVNDWGHYITAGAQIVHDVAGDSKLTRTQILPVMAYHAQIAETGMYISGGIMAGIVTGKFDPTGLRWDDQFVNGSYNPTNPTQQVLLSNRRNYFDLNAGVIVSGVATEAIDYYLGASVFHATTPVISFSSDSLRLSRRWGFNGGLGLQCNDYSKLTLYADYFYQKAAAAKARVGSLNVLMAGLYYTYDLVQYDTDDKVQLTGGLVYRLNDALAPVIRLDIKQLGVGLSYDINVSDLTAASQARGGFELTLAYKASFASRRIKSYRMRCVSPF